MSFVILSEKLPSEKEKKAEFRILLNMNMKRKSERANMNKLSRIIIQKIKQIWKKINFIYTEQ